MIEQTFNRQGSLCLACGGRGAFFASEQPKRYKIVVMSRGMWCPPLSFGRYVYKILLEIVWTNCGNSNGY